MLTLPDTIVAVPPPFATLFTKPNLAEGSTAVDGCDPLQTNAL